MGRTVPLGVLEQVRIASPCPMRWEDMAPVEGDRVRHCGSCDLNVYNLSGMPRDEAENLVLAHAGGERLCVQMHVRADGRVLTRDCPVGLRAARLRLARLASRLAAAVVCFVTGGVLARSRERADVPGLARVQPFATICDWVRPGTAPQILVPAGVIRGEALLGRVAPIRPPSAPSNPGSQP